MDIIYFNYNATVKTGTNQLKNYAGVDTRNDNGIIICPPTKYKLLNGTEVLYKHLGGILIDIPQYLLAEMTDKREVKIKVKKEKCKKVYPVITIPDSSSLVVNLLNLLPQDWFDDYNKWKDL